MDLTVLPQRTADELDAMRAAGRVVAQTLAAVRAAAAPGVKLRELDDLAKTTMYEAGATSSFLGYKPSWAPTAYNGVLCLSPNEVVVHGRPSGQRLKDGDLLSVDCGAVVDGWNGDAAFSVLVGERTSDEDARLVRATEEALAAGIAAAVPGATLLDVARAVDAVARRYGYAHLPDHGGHGIGRSMHEPPFVPNQPLAGLDRVRLHAGSTLAIEPMLLAGGGRYRHKKDGWAVVTADGRRAAHVEHTVAVTDDGPVVLTAA
ncbi:type I methionyl aminopeptidase [Geodermatophilus amargosae]|uniref:type I methionyl aminopeptidase n=1 Tax=Geodermatophilus amargosae TaxID=1296565 RepID=UPI001FE4D626|nr:type I methionyl aminopeptidase [Geodermatophilus amargosae]